MAKQTSGFSGVKHEKTKRPSAVFQNCSSLHREECRSDEFALITGLRLLLALWSWVRITSHQFTIKVNHTRLRGQKLAMDQSSPRLNNRIMWHFVMSVTGDPADDTDGTGIYWIPTGAKSATIVRSRTCIHTLLPATKHIVCNDSCKQTWHTSQQGMLLTAASVMLFDECLFAHLYKHNASQVLTASRQTDNLAKRHTWGGSALHLVVIRQRFCKPAAPWVWTTFPLSTYCTLQTIQRALVVWSLRLGCDRWRTAIPWESWERPVCLLCTFSGVSAAVWFIRCWFAPWACYLELS